MIDVAEPNRGRRSQPLRDVEHVFAAIALRDKGMLDCVEEALPAAAVNQAVISRVLAKIVGYAKSVKNLQVVCPAKSAPKRFP